MREDAGNDDQGLTMDGFGITVVAAQYTYEHDSESDQYDKDAEYPVSLARTGSPVRIVTCWGRPWGTGMPAAAARA